MAKVEGPVLIGSRHNIENVNQPVSEKEDAEEQSENVHDVPLPPITLSPILLGKDKRGASGPGRGRIVGHHPTRRKWGTGRAAEERGGPRENQCTDKGVNGIEVKDEAEPTLEDNVCSGNAPVGMGLSDSVGGMARENDCSGNRWGIYVAETADPEVKDNDCRYNMSGDVLDLRHW
jgi:parallel beta-helix repeat protein